MSYRLFLLTLLATSSSAFLFACNSTELPASPIDSRALSLPVEGATLYTVDDYIPIIDDVSVNEKGTLKWAFAHWIEFYWAGSELAPERSDESDLFRLVCLTPVCEIGNSDALETDGRVLQGTVAVWRFDSATALKLEGYGAEDFWMNADPDLAQKAIDTGLNRFDDTPLYWTIVSGNDDIVVVLIDNDMLISGRSLHAVLDRGPRGTALVESMLASGANPNAVRDGLTALEKAVPSGTQQVASLLEYGADVTPDSLVLAMSREVGDLEVLQLLLDSLSADQLPYKTNGLLELAIRDSRYEVFVALLEAGVPPTPDDLDAALVSPSMGSFSNVQKLLDHGAQPSDPSLQKAIARGNSEVVQLLLEHGATAGPHHLQSAVSIQDAEIVQLLLEHRVELEANHLLSALANRYERMVALLLAFDAPLPRDALRWPIGRGDLDLTEDLLLAGASLRPEHLALAIQRQAPDIVALLLSHGVETPPDAVATAVDSEQHSTLGLLLAAGADATPQALELAVALDDHESVVLLTQYGAAPSHPIVMSSIAGSSESLVLKLLERLDEAAPAAIVAALNRSDFSAEILRALFELGGDPNLLIGGAYSLLFHAAQRGNLEAVELAIEFGADIDAVGGERDWTALHGLAFTRDPSADVARALIAAGADTEAPTTDGETPCDIAGGNRTAGPLLPLLCDQ